MRYARRQGVSPSLFALLTTPSLAGGIFDFDEIVEKHIAELGIPIEDVNRLQLDLQRNEIRGKRRNVGVNAWLRLNSCETGSLVIEMSMDGAIKQVYTRGGCEVAGIRSFSR